MAALRTIGFFLLAILAPLVMLVVALGISAAFLSGTIWATGKIFPYVSALNGLVLVFTIFVLLPNAFFSSTPRFAGGGLMIASAVFAFTTWLWCMLLAWSTLVLGGMILGLIFAGVGVVPLAILGTLINGAWGTLGELALWALLSIGSWAWGARLLEKAQRRRLA